MRAHSNRNGNQTLNGDQTVRKIVQGRQRMLTRDLFAVANLLVDCLIGHHSFEPHRRTKFQGEPPRWRRQIHCGGKILQLSPFISETARDRPV